MHRSAVALHVLPCILRLCHCAQASVQTGAHAVAGSGRDVDIVCSVDCTAPARMLLSLLCLPAAVLPCRSEIAQVQAGAERQRRKRLGTAAVVGVTCCAALQVRTGPAGRRVGHCWLCEHSVTPLECIPSVKVDQLMRSAAHQQVMGCRAR